MAKISRAQGPSYEPEEFDNLEYVPPVAREKVRRAEVGPMPRANGEEEAPSDGDNLPRTTAAKAKSGNSESKSGSEPAPGTENPSEPQGKETGSVASSVDGTAPRTEIRQSGEGPNVGKALGEPEPQEKPPPPKSRAAKKAATQNPKSVNVRTLGDDDDF